jgi:large subunit ribosomal protein L5
MSTANTNMTKERAAGSFAALKDKHNLTNKLAAPKFVKVVVSVASGGLMKKDRHKNDLIMDRLAKITGQKPSLRKAKQSNASFKIRQGDPIGVAVTLRGARMYDFLDKVLNIALPRTKDFRGIDAKTLDDIGNMTFGIKEHTIFPEIKDEELKDVFGMAVTLVTTAKNKTVAKDFFDLIEVPFKKIK